MTIDGEIVGAVAVLQYISELDLISTELEYTRKLTSELTAIIESSFDGMYITDGNTKTNKKEDDICFSAVKLFFAYGLGNGLYFPFSVGATTVLMPERPQHRNLFITPFHAIIPRFFWGSHFSELNLAAPLFKFWGTVLTLIMAVNQHQWRIE